MDKELDDISRMKQILKDYHEPNKLIFWRDILSFSLIGWVLITYSSFNFILPLYLVGVFMLYKGGMLIHEISHLAKKIKGIRTAYDLLLGYPISYPSYIYDTHLYHHGKKTYGTLRDPEYLYIENFSGLTLIRPLFAAFLLPIFQWIRFGIVPFITPFMPRKFKVHLFQKYSTLVFSMAYVRPIRNEEQSLMTMMREDLLCASYKVGLIALLYFEILPMRFLFIYYIAFVIASLLNMYRALFNHIYANKSGESLSWEDHLMDTATIKAGPITNLFFINGLNYHALHHLFPELPYHNLKAAHFKLVDELEEDHIYKKCIFNSVYDLVKFCMCKERLARLTVNKDVEPAL
jgi:fatty acid desaturase